MFQAGSIIGQIGASVAPLKAAFSTAINDTKQFSGSFGGALLGATAAIGGLAAAFTAVRSSMEQIDAAAKSADAIGVTTEAFAALSHQANLAGADMAQVSMSLSRMQGRLVEAAQGSKTAQDAFATLGVDVRELIGLPAEQAFGRLGDALAGIENPAQRARAAAEIFGERAGPRLMALLMEGSAGIAAARQEAESLGLTFNRVDAAKVEEANDAISRVGAALVGIGRSLAVAVAPAVDTAAKAVQSLIGIFRGGESTMSKFSASMLQWGAGLAGALLIIPRMISAIRAIVAAFRAMASAQAITQALSGPKGWAVLAAGALIAAGAVAGVSAAFDDISDTAVQAQTSVTQSVAGMADQSAEAAKTAVEAIDRIKAALREANEAASGENLTAGIGLGTSQYNEALKLVEQLKVAREQAFANDAVAGMRQARQSIGRSPEEAALERINRALGVNSYYAQTAKVAYEDLRRATVANEVETLTQSLWDQVKMFGMSASQIAIYKLEVQGAGKEMVAAARNAEQSLNKLQAGAKLDELRTEVSQFGMTDTQKRVEEFKGMPGVGEDQVAEYRRLMGEIESLTKGKEIAAEIEQWRDSLQGPVEKYEEIIEKLREWREAGRISQEEFEKGTKQAQADLNKSRSETREPQFASLITRGSAEELKLTFAAQTGGKDEIPRKHLSVAERTQTTIGELRDIWRNLEVV